MYAYAVMESISFTQLLSVDFEKKNGVHPCIYKMCKYNKWLENEWWNDYSVGRQCTAIGMVLHKRPKFGQKELHGFIASDRDLFASSYKKQQIWARVSITLDCALGIEDVA